MTRTVPAPPETALPSRPVTTRLDRARLQRAKASYTTRHVDLDRATGLLASVRPAVGDLVLAAVTSIGQHPKIEGQDGRRASLFPGDEVVIAYGHRYAPDQFEASVPDDLGPCDLVAAGGIAARVDNAHGKMGPPTTLAPVGLLTTADGSRLRLASGSTRRPATARPVTIAVVGAAMNAGKTTTAAHLVRGLRRAGLRVGAAKTTGPVPAVTSGCSAMPAPTPCTTSPGPGCRAPTGPAPTRSAGCSRPSTTVSPRTVARSWCWRSPTVSTRRRPASSSPTPPSSSASTVSCSRPATPSAPLPVSRGCTTTTGPR